MEISNQIMVKNDMKLVHEKGTLLLKMLQHHI